MKRSKCKLCDNPVWSNGLCKNHTKRTLLKKADIKNIERRLRFYTGSADKKVMSEATQSWIKRRELFQKIWDSKPHKSEISGAHLGSKPLTTFFHHILPKSTFPQAEFDEENIILMTPDEHGNVENNMYRFDEVNSRRLLLQKKYNLI